MQVANVRSFPPQCMIRALTLTEPAVQTAFLISRFAKLTTSLCEELVCGTYDNQIRQ
jgi:hypothetical protein